MERIAAASNLIIEVQPESWRLLVNGTGIERVLVEVLPGEPVRFGTAFGNRRQLPSTGILPREDIQRIVLGWSEKDDAWHLGLVLKGDLVSERGSRWCGLAHWHDPRASEYQYVATQAGQTLAEQVGRPFSVIPPQGSEAPVLTDAAMPQPAAAAPLPEPIPQPALPLRFDLWTFRQAEPSRLEFSLSSAWGRSKLMRVAWNIVWLAVFVILTATTLTSGIALPRPEILVYFGFASIIILALTILYNLFETLTYTNRIVFDASGVRWMRGKRVRRTVPQDQIAEVYVSHVVNKVGKRGKAAEQRAVTYGELNLLLRSGEFRSVFSQMQGDEVIPVTDDPINEEAVVTLNEYNARTRLQAAALRIARVLGVDAEYDKRLK
jgi:hypothetical protein